jgi:hypothetical protein
MNGKIEQCVCIKFCVKLSKSAPEILHVSRPVECQLKATNIQGDQARAKQQRMFKKLENSFTKAMAKQP